MKGAPFFLIVRSKISNYPPTYAKWDFFVTVAAPHTHTRREDTTVHFTFRCLLFFRRLGVPRICVDIILVAATSRPRAQRCSCCCLCQRLACCGLRLRYGASLSLRLLPRESLQTLPLFIFLAYSLRVVLRLFFPLLPVLSNFCAVPLPLSVLPSSLL